MLVKLTYRHRVETTEKVRPYTIYVEGNVGCGKSTFLELFESDKRIQIVQEPVAEWQNVSGSTNKAFHRFGKAKLTNCGLVLGPGQFSVLPSCLQK